MDAQDIQNVFLAILSYLLLLTSLQLPLVENRLPFPRRLLPNFNGFPYNGRDVFTMISEQAWLFWRNTGETPDSFMRIANDLMPTLFRLTADGAARVRQRRQKISLINQVLLVLIWLRKYPHVDSLALLFDIDPASVVRTVYRIVPVFWRYFQNQVVWPNLAEWNNLMGTWHEFPNAVGSIDVTPHEIYRPLTEPQRLFYSGHRHYDLMNTQLIVDAEGHIRFLQAGFLGSTHDALSFRLMEPVGPGRNLDLPPNARLLADRAYPDGAPILTAVRAGQMHLLNPRERRRACRFNRALARRRIKVEHIFKEVKTYNAVGQIWLHQRWLMPVCVELATFLAERRVRFFRAI